MARNSCKQGFLAMSSLLQKIYRQHPAGDLGNLIIDLNPLLFSEKHLSSFPAFEDYADLYKKETACHKTKTEASFDASIDFLLFYQREFDFQLTNVIGQFSRSAFERELSKINI